MCATTHVFTMKTIGKSSAVRPARSPSIHPKCASNSRGTSPILPKKEASETMGWKQGQDNRRGGMAVKGEGEGCKTHQRRLRMASVVYLFTDRDSSLNHPPFSKCVRSLPKLTDIGHSLSISRFRPTTHPIC